MATIAVLAAVPVTTIAMIAATPVVGRPFFLLAGRLQ